jgi:hypothetical protein
MKFMIEDALALALDMNMLPMHFEGKSHPMPKNVLGTKLS